MPTVAGHHSCYIRQEIAETVQLPMFRVCCSIEDQNEILMDGLRNRRHIDLYLKYNLTTEEIDGIYNDKSSRGDQLRTVANRIRDVDPTLEALPPAKKDFEMHLLMEFINTVRKGIEFAADKQLKNLISGKLCNESFVYYRLMDPTLPEPRRGSGHAAGIELYLPETVTLDPMESRTVNLKIAICLPQGSCGILYPRNTLAQCNVTLLGGIVDCDYRGTLHAIFFNLNKTPIHLIKHNRYVQLNINKLWYPVLKQDSEGFDVTDM